MANLLLVCFRKIEVVFGLPPELSVVVVVPNVDPRLLSCSAGYGSGFRVPGSGFRASGFGFWVPDFGFRVPGPGSRVPGLGFRVQGLDFRVCKAINKKEEVQGFGFRVLKSWSRVSIWRVHEAQISVIRVAFRRQKWCAIQK